MDDGLCYLFIQDARRILKDASGVLVLSPQHPQNDNSPLPPNCTRYALITVDVIDRSVNDRHRRRHYKHHVDVGCPARCLCVHETRETFP